MLNYWFFFFWPLYFQAVQLSTPIRSGVQILPITLIALPRAAIWTVALSKWGVAILAAILNIHSSQYAADIIGNPTVNSWLQNGDAYAKATRDFAVSLPEPTPSQVIEVFTRSLKREVKLRKVLKTEFGLESKKTNSSRKE
ncbi:hypothetical protein PG990_014945 [Apiospora arundinis]